MTILIHFYFRICGISTTRGREFRKYRPRGFESEEEKKKYQWWRGKLFIHGFNKACKNISVSFMKVEYEYMSEIIFRTMEKGNFPHFSYIFRKPEPLGT